MSTPATSAAGRPMPSATRGSSRMSPTPKRTGTSRYIVSVVWAKSCAPLSQTVGEGGVVEHRAMVTRRGRSGIGPSRGACLNLDGVDCFVRRAWGGGRAAGVAARVPPAAISRSKATKRRVRFHFCRSGEDLDFDVVVLIVGGTAVTVQAGRSGRTTPSAAISFSLEGVPSIPCRGRGPGRPELS